MTWLRLRVGNCSPMFAGKRKSVSHKMRFDIIAATFFVCPPSQLPLATCQLPFFSVAIAFFGQPVHSSALIKDCAIRATCFELIYAAGVMAYQWLVVCRPLDRFITMVDTLSRWLLWCQYGKVARTKSFRMATGSCWPTKGRLQAKLSLPLLSTHKPS